MNAGLDSKETEVIRKGLRKRGFLLAWLGLIIGVPVVLFCARQNAGPIGAVALIVGFILSFTGYAFIGISNGYGLGAGCWALLSLAVIQTNTNNFVVLKPFADEEAFYSLAWTMLIGAAIGYVVIWLQKPNGDVFAAKYRFNRSDKGLSATIEYCNELVKNGIDRIARDLLEKATKKFPNSPELWELLGATYERQMSPKSANRCFQEAARLRQLQVEADNS